MYSLDNLLHRVKLEDADQLRFFVGNPPVIVLRGKPHTLEGPTISPEDAEALLRTLANTRQRRELRARGAVQFFYRFRSSTIFVVRAKLEDESVRIEIH